DTHQIGLGVGYSFPDPLAMHEAPITIDLAAQLSQVEAREANKDDPEDAVGDLRAGGAIWHLTLTLRHDFH
ncbi:hypothetical protein KKF91_15880, partial [Myxococcota bacterium]|nr:hypothetical protein [Myxococcota bacterium]